MTRRRVGITGLGIVGPHGNDVEATFSALLRGKSAVRSIEISSEVGSLEFVGAVTPPESWQETSNLPLATSDKVSLYALAAADASIRDAKLQMQEEDLSKVGVAVGTSLGGAISQEAAYYEIVGRKKSRLSPFTLVKVMYNGPAAQVALRYRLGGPSLTYSTTCSSSSVSVGEAMRVIRHGYADVMLAGGAEALFAYVSLRAWQALHVLAPPHVENVAATCRPFNKDRNGTVLGDGAAFVVLESFDHALKRGAKIYAELAGYGVCNDANHMTQPSVEGQVRAMGLAIADAEMSADEIDYVNAHGTGTPLNDVTETRAIRTVFGRHASKIAVSSTKSMHGHLVGAAGALELAISTMAVAHESVPPTAHLDEPDAECDLDYVPNIGRRMQVRAAMSNSFAVGGTAGVLVVRRVNQ